MEIQSVAVIGAGAVGSYFIRCLSGVPELSLSVIAEGERAERLRRDGLVINGDRTYFRVCSPEDAAGADLYIVSVKYNALSNVIELLKRSVGGNSLVLCPMNGVDNEKALREALGEERVIDSMMKIFARRIGNGITYDPDKTKGIYFGEADGQRSERVDALSRLFERTGMHYHVSENILRDMWYKFALNVSRNIPQAILNCGQGAFEASGHVNALARGLRVEVVRVAAAMGVDISDETNPSGVNSNVPYDTRYSTLQDLDAKRPTEIDAFCGAVCRMGRELGVETPCNEFAFHAVRALEEMNAGKIR